MVNGGLKLLMSKNNKSVIVGYYERQSVCSVPVLLYKRFVGELLIALLLIGM